MRVENFPLKKRREILLNIKNDREFRIQYCEHDKKMFANYYFENIMTHEAPDFHNDYYNFAESWKNLCLVWFRWCAKSWIFWLIDIVHDICYKKESFIIFLAYNKWDAKLKVRNIVTALKTNKKIRDDFWYLFEDETSWKKNLNKMPESKSVSSFITTNEIRVESFSMDQAARWFSFLDSEGNLIRPSKVVADDIAVLANSKNKNIVDKDFIFLMEELLWWVKWKIIFLLNAISEYSLPVLLEKQFSKNINWIFHKIAIIENEKITWPSKYCWTEKEALEFNIQKLKDFHIESIEMFKSRWKKSFNTNYMNVPEIAVWDPVFDQDLLFAISPKKVIKKHTLIINWKRFVLFIFSTEKNVSCWVDVANWGWWDNSSITWSDINWKLVFQWASNEIEPYELAYLIKTIHYKLWYIYYKNCLVIEKNNSWIAVIQELRHDKYIYRLIYRKRIDAGVKDTPTNQVWFHTWEASKEMLKWEIDKRIELKTLDVSEEELYELMRYIYNDKWACNASPWEKDDRVISKGLSFMWLLYKK